MTIIRDPDNPEKFIALIHKSWFDALTSERKKHMKASKPKPGKPKPRPGC